MITLRKEGIYLVDGVPCESHATPKEEARKGTKSDDLIFWTTIYKLAPELKTFYWKGKSFESLPALGRSMLEKLWKNDMNLDFSNKIFSILDMKLDNEATLYAAISSRSASIVIRLCSKSDNKEESLHIMIVSFDNSQTYSESVDFGYVASSVVGLSKTGKVILGGFYRKDLSKNLVGSYMSILDPQREELTFDTIGFPKDYYSGKGMSGFMSRIPAASAYETNADCIMEYDDGSLLLLGEMRTYIQYCMTII